MSTMSFGSSKGGAGIIEAVETLTELAELDYEAEIGLTQDHELVIQGRSTPYQTVHWLNARDPKLTIRALRDTFRTVLTYFRRFYRQHYGKMQKGGAEQIKNIMVLVGDAAQKIDQYTDLFRGQRGGSVMNLREFKQLQKFYLTKVAQKPSDQRFWEKIVAPAMKKKRSIRMETVAKGRRKKENVNRVIVDLDAVKRDTEYELLFLRKPTGKRFYQPQLFKSIKLVCNLGSVFGKKAGDDPLLRTKIWLDQFCQITAANMIQKSQAILDQFYREALEFRDKELVGVMSKALMALFLSSNPRNLLRNQPVKASHSYFEDFQRYLRKAMDTREYQKLLMYPPKKSQELERTLLELIHGLCRSMVIHCQGHFAFQAIVQFLIKQGLHEMGSEGKQASSFTEELEHRYQALKKVLLKHPSGPLIKTLDLVEEKKARQFDNFLQRNLPHQLYHLFFKGGHMTHVRLPCPTTQDQVDKASIVPEFTAFLEANKQGKKKKKHVLFNLQDRTSWREHARSVALEELQDLEEFHSVFNVVTLAKNTEFYHQVSLYEKESRADVFIQNFKDQIRGERAGFFFSVHLSHRVLGTFLDQVMDGVHQLFFEKKNVLSREDRLAFIDFVYLLIELKVLDILKPESFSFTCKDGVDTGSVESTALFVLSHFVNDQKFEEKDGDFLSVLLFAPALLMRERGVHPDRMQRFLGFVKRLESSVGEAGALAFRKKFRRIMNPLFANQLIQAEAHLPKPLQNY